VDIRDLKVAHSMFAVLQLSELECALAKWWNVLGGLRGRIKN